MGAIARKQRVGRYELVQVLGEGGMGTVWLAHPYDAPDQLYAVKTVSAQYTSDPRVCTMFVKEASLAAAIDHPNVVRLYDVGLHDDVPFFVMEWIDGYSLRNVARRVAETGERVPAAIALRIASDLCAGLHAAHELRGDDGVALGLVHRDVSPHNVLVTREGIAKLIDFGVAKARDLATGSDQSVCGGLKGKVRYMAPEQALEKPIDRRADLFSVGAITYQLLTGRAPFEGPNELAIINALLSTNPVFVPEDLPEPVQWILRRALARRPENRFADAQEMHEAIELALVELGQPDSHAHVAECLAWFEPLDEDDEITSQRQPPLVPLEGADAGTSVLTPGASQPPAPIAFATTAGSIPARQSSLPDDAALDAMRRQRARAATAGSWRFILAGAAFVGVLGLVAALLVRDTPRKPAAREAAAVAAAEETPLPAPTPQPIVPSGVSTTTPIIDMGDLEDTTPGRASKPRAKRSPQASQAPRPAAASTADKNVDLAGPLKVWK
ncbi:MAG: protein kinase [Labilithrix sp.]|nr:protein kinase [Labilithrix sp.]MCW5834331.1 protein kinase [Labilithrix sp.]